MHYRAHGILHVEFMFPGGIGPSTAFLAFVVISTVDADCCKS